MMGRRVTLIIGIALSALFLWLAARGVDLHAMARTIARTNLWYMPPCAALTLIGFWLRSLRWRYLLHSVRPIPQSILFPATMIGFLANNVLPARLGELVRAHVVGRRAEISRSSALASIVVERIFDLFTLLALFVVVVLISKFPGGLDKLAIVVLVIGLVALALLLAWNRYPEPVVRLLLRFVPRRIRGRAEDFANRFGEGLHVFDSAGHLVLVGLLSVAMWAAIVVVNWLAIRSLAINVPEPQAAMVALVAISLVTMIPSAPGFIGTLQGGGTAALLVFGIPKEQGLAFSIVYHATQWIPINMVGAAFLLREGLSLGQLSRLVSRGASDGAPAGRDGESVKRS
jgi:glycosyltransferase 2 family protein